MNAKILADHAAGECWWPMDMGKPNVPVNADTSQRLFCCEPVWDAGQRYCLTHDKVVYPGRRR
jgi:hypothetical protein